MLFDVSPEELYQRLARRYDSVPPTVRTNWQRYLWAYNQYRRDQRSSVAAADGARQFFDTLGKGQVPDHRGTTDRPDSTNLKNGGRGRD